MSTMTASATTTTLPRTQRRLAIFVSMAKSTRTAQVEPREDRRLGVP